MAVPEKAISLIKQFEGCSLKRYTDITGHSTIGWGHECTTQDGLSNISMELADHLLEQDAKIAMNTILRTTNVPINNNQLSALIDFAFNLGGETYQRSTLRQVINRREFSDAPEHFLRYSMAGGRKVKGLLRRREAEANLFMEKS